MMLSTNPDVLTSEIHIAAAPEQVFQALVNPTEVPKWWGQKGVYFCREYQADLRVGGTWHSVGVGDDGGPFEIKGEFLEIDPPRALSYTWIASWTGDAQTTVRWELSPTDRGTQVTVRHSGLSAHPELAKSYSGWPRMLTWLQVFLENGETAENRPAA